MASPEQRVAPDPGHNRALGTLSRKPLTATHAARLIASVTVAVTLAIGVVMHWAD
jgi:hypothetical protein